VEDLAKPENFLFFMAFVVPGFVAMKAYSMVIEASLEKNAATLLIESVIYSVMLFVPLGAGYLWAANAIKTGLVLEGVSVWIAVTFLAPAIIGYVLVRIRLVMADQGWGRHPICNAWDYIFSEKSKCRDGVFLRVRTVDGRWLGGAYMAGSLASAQRSEKSLCIAKAYDFDEHGFVHREVPVDRSVLVESSAISTVEFFRYADIPYRSED
jgi:hypothetical protein